MFERNVVAFEFKNIRVHALPNFLFGHVMEDGVFSRHTKTIQGNCVAKDLSLQLQVVGIDEWPALTNRVPYVLVNRTQAELDVDERELRWELIHGERMLRCRDYVEGFGALETEV